MRDIVKKIGKTTKLLFISVVLIYIFLLLLGNPISNVRNSGFDLKSALLISAGFAGSFRAMMCCRKKV